MPYILYYIVISLCNDDVFGTSRQAPPVERNGDASFNRKNQIEFNHVRERERKRKIVDHEGNQMHISGMEIMEFFSERNLHEKQ